MSLTDFLAKEVGVRPACNALAVSRAGFYRWKNPPEDSEKEFTDDRRSTFGAKPRKLNCSSRCPIS
ncbi:MAG: hypothetical protein HY739_06780 [Desulfobacterales bacterium]|nr:hypothetical protein [Desulfobacterales bacterium]